MFTFWLTYSALIVMRRCVGSPLQLRTRNSRSFIEIVISHLGAAGASAGTGFSTIFSTTTGFSTTFSTTTGFSTTFSTITVSGFVPNFARICSCRA